MKKRSNNITTLSEFLEKEYGKIGTPKRDEFEEGYKAFELGFLLREARIEKGMTQEELAKKVGTSKSYISKIENNLKEVRFSTLQKIVHRGLGGELDLKIIL